MHYVGHGTPIREDGTQRYTSACRAAVVTEAEPDPFSADGDYVVGLAVLNPTGTFFNQGVTQDEEGKTGGTWHWPERVG